MLEIYVQCCSYNRDTLSLNSSSVLISVDQRTGISTCQFTPKISSCQKTFETQDQILATKITWPYKGNTRNRLEIKSTLDTKKSSQLIHNPSSRLVTTKCSKSSLPHFVKHNPATCPSKLPRGHVKAPVDHENEKLWILDKKLSQKKYKLTWY